MLSNVIAAVPRVWKAIVAAVTAGSAAYAGAVDGGVSADEWIVVAAAAATALVLTYLVPNKPAG